VQNVWKHGRPDSYTYWYQLTPFLVPKHELKHLSTYLRLVSTIDAMFGVLRRRSRDRSAREVEFDVALSRVSYVGATKQSL